MDKIKTIIGKEWAEVFKNRLVLFTVAFLPLVLTALPLATLAATGNVPADEVSGMPTDLSFFGDLCVGLSEMDCTQVYMVSLFALMFMILPVMIPVTIAAYSIVGEKTTRSLEPLLATPITTIELLVGKALAAIIPAIIASWLSFAIFLVGVRVLANEVVFGRLLQPLWLIAIFIVGPLLTVLAVSVAIMVSSRVTDPRVAEQLSGIVILPIIFLLIGQSVGWILINQQVVLVMAIAVALLDVLLVYLTLRLFQRETILTRWK
jgi:ABC-2 type transport system permease protein